MRYLQGITAIEVNNARLNMSSKEVENKVGGSQDNKTYVKKIKNDEGTFPYASVQNIKSNIKRIANEVYNQRISTVTLETQDEDGDKKKKQTMVIEADPYKNFDEDVMGFMRAKTETLTQKKFDCLPEEEKSLYTKDDKKYVLQLTKKRYRRLFINAMQAIGRTTIQEEFCTRQTTGYSVPYTKEIYSCKMAMPLCMEIDKVGRFSTTPDNRGYVDYLPHEVKGMDVEIDKDGNFELSIEERFNRIYSTLKSIQFLNSDVGNQMESLNSQFIILAEYRIGGGMFCNIFKNNSLNIDHLKETIDANECFRLSKIYIGITTGFMGNLKNQLEEKFKEDDRIVLSSVWETFDKYLNGLCLVDVE